MKQIHIGTIIAEKRKQRGLTDVYKRQDILNEYYLQNP